MPLRRIAAPILVLAFAATAGCSLNTLGGREQCWPESDARAASLFRGVLEADANGWRLRTPEGDAIPLLPGAIQMRDTGHAFSELVQGNDVVARTGDDVTLFGGAGADGALVVCAVEEKHSS